MPYKIEKPTQVLSTIFGSKKPNFHIIGIILN